MENTDPKIFAAELRRKMPELDLHGLFPDEIENKIDLFLYDNVKKDEENVTIIFGIGEGKLREVVLTDLSKHPLVDRIVEKVGSCVVILSRHSHQPHGGKSNI